MDLNLNVNLPSLPFFMRSPSKRDKVVCRCPSHVFSQVYLITLPGLQWNGKFLETFPFGVVVEMIMKGHGVSFVEINVQCFS